MTILTASALERAEFCPMSFSLPQIENVSEDAARGHEIHGYLQRRINGASLEAALEHVEEENRDTCRGIDFSKLLGDFRPGTVRSEVAYAIDVKEGRARMLGRNIERRYVETALDLGEPLRPYEIAGTIDVEGTLFNGREIAGDFKAGHLPLVPVVDHRQIHFEVTARRLVADVDEVEGRLFKIDEGGGVRIDPHVFDTFELDEIQTDLLEIHEGIVEARALFQEKDEIQVTPGSWCRYCPAIQCCPAHVELARALPSNLDTVVASLARMTPEQEWRAVTIWKDVEKLLDRIGDSMKAIGAQRFARGTPIRSPDGLLEFRPITSTKSSFSKELALSLLRQCGAEEDQIAKLWIPKTYESFRILKAKGAKPAKVKKERKKKNDQPNANASLGGVAIGPGSADTSPSRDEMRRERDGG